MRKPTRIAVIAGTAGVIALAGTGAALAAAGGGGQQPAVAAASPAPDTTADNISAAEARQIAQQQLPGAAVTQTSLDDEHGRAVWEVDLTRNHHGYEVSIDAATGNVVSTHTDDHD